MSVAQLLLDVGLQSLLHGDMQFVAAWGPLDIVVVGPEECVDHVVGNPQL